MHTCEATIRARCANVCEGSIGGLIFDGKDLEISETLALVMPNPGSAELVAVRCVVLEGTQGTGDSLGMRQELTVACVYMCVCVCVKHERRMVPLYQEPTPRLDVAATLPVRFWLKFVSQYAEGTASWTSYRQSNTS